MTQWISFSPTSFKMNFSHVYLKYNCLTELISIVIVTRLTLELEINWAEMSKFLHPGSELALICRWKLKGRENCWLADAQLTWTCRGKGQRADFLMLCGAEQLSEPRKQNG
jgi:hypothetical protein